MQKGHLITAGLLLLAMMLFPAIAPAIAGRAPSVVTTATKPESISQETVTVFRHESKRVESYSVTDYLFGVVAAELPMRYPDEAVKAQIVAAHTLMRNRIVARKTTPDSRLPGAQMTDDSAVDQGFIPRKVALEKWGAQAETYQTRLDGLIGAVSGQLLTYKGKPALTVYHALSAGRTESAKTMWGSDYPYLTEVESVGDLMNEQYITKKTVTRSDFIAALAKITPTAATSELAAGIGQPAKSKSGTVLTLPAMGKTYKGTDLRRAFSLRSANFDVEEADGQITFTVRGYGHGVGMSQFGASVMAQQGSTYQEILAWYYPGCKLVGG
ncbi:MAG: stage II sporulation protein D [Clostridia bacterium]|nr:stage II sporulation protein D [Clostridia bacterium]